MYVFPALNSSFKSRKRTFRCCELCRLKRTKCDITGVDFEVAGCSNCRKHGWPCSFIKGPKVKVESPLTESPLESASPNALAPDDMKDVTIHYLRQKFNFNTAALNSDLAYQFVYNEHPVALISNANADDSSMWHPSGVFVSLNPKVSTSYQMEGFGGRKIFNHIVNRKTYNYLLSIHAFTLASPEFDFTHHETTTLLQIYFFKINSVLPIVHEKRFWDDYHAQRPNSCMMYAIVLAVLRDSMAEPILRQVFLRSKNQLNGAHKLLHEYTSEEYAEDFANYMDDLETKIRQINLILPQLGDIDKLTKLVVHLLLLMHYRADRLGSEQSSHDLTAALNLATSLAIHRKPVEESVLKERIEYSTNLWWCCFVFDRFNAITNCRVLFVKQEDTDVDLPYLNLNLLRMVQLARVFENMLVAVYRPYSKIPLAILTNDSLTRPEIFNLDEFRILEFDYCAKEIALCSPRFELLSRPLNMSTDLPTYTANALRLMTRVVNNLVIIISQKLRFRNPAIDNLIPRKAMLQAGANVLWYLRHIDEEQKINIPLITWALSVSMTAYLKVRTKKILTGILNPDLENVVPRYQFEDFLAELENYKSKWWIVGEVTNLTNDFITKLELKRASGAHPKRPAELEDSKDNSPSVAITRSASIPSIQNIINAPPEATGADMYSNWNLARAGSNEYDRYFESMHVDIFDNEFFKDVPNVINTL